MEMKTKFLFPLLLISIAIAILPSCKKKVEGCMDQDSENYNSKANKDDNSCVYRYVTGVQINSFPSLKPDGTPWDSQSAPCGDDGTGNAPDLQIHFITPKGASYYTINSTDLMANIYLTPAGSFPGNTDTPIKFTHETWSFELLDNDLICHELMGTGTFNPFTEGSNGIINVTGTNGVSITIHYHN
jgi:hypothetical protein